MRLTIVTSVLVTVLGGCAERPRPAPAPVRVEQAAAQPPAEARAPAPTALISAGAPPAEVPLSPIVVTKVEVPGGIVAGVARAVEGVPPLRLADVSEENAAASTAANKAGLEAFRAGLKARKAGREPETAERFKAAQAEYLKALQLNPGNIYARYNLACLFARMSDGRTKAVLAQLASSGCPLCLDRVAAAPKDKDFADLKADPELVAMAKAAADRLAAHGAATVAVEATSEDGAWVYWTQLSTAGYPFRVGDRVTLTWDKPTAVASVAAGCAEEACAVDKIVVTFPNAAAQEPEDGRLATPVTTASVTVWVARTYAAFGVGPRTLIIGLQGSASPAPSTPASSPKPAAAPSLSWDPKRSAFVAEGFPAVSADGKHLALFDDPSDADSDGKVTVQVLNGATGKVEQKALVADFGHQAASSQAPVSYEPAIEKAKALMASVSPTWRPLLAVGGGDPWDGSSGLASGVYAELVDTSLRVVDLTRGVIHESEHPRWAAPTTLVGGETLGLQWGGMWLDKGTNTLVIRAYYHPGSCPGGGYYKWYVVAL